MYIYTYFEYKLKQGPSNALRKEAMMIVSWQDIDNNPNLVGQRIASAQAGYAYDYDYFPSSRKDEIWDAIINKKSGYRIELDDKKQGENPSIIIWTVWRV